MQSSEAIKDENTNLNDGNDSSKKGIVCLMQSTVQLFKLGISPKTYKVCVSRLFSKGIGKTPKRVQLHIGEKVSKYNS